MNIECESNTHIMLLAAGNKATFRVWAQFRAKTTLNKFTLILNSNMFFFPVSGFPTSCCRESPFLNWGHWTRLRQEVETQRDATAATVMMRMVVAVQVVARIRRISPESPNVSLVLL